MIKLTKEVLMKDIIDLYNLNNQEISEILSNAEDIMENREKYAKSLEGKVLASLFFEPSTRTNFSFTAAMQRLGGSVIGFSDASSSSTAKGESLKDTIKTISAYADFIVMRNPYEGSAKAASLYTDKPLINAGDGGHLHPTQTLTDLLTIKKYHGNLNDFTIGLCGDLKHGRTVQSLIKSLTKYENIKFVLISHEELKLQDHFVSFMTSQGAKFEIVESLEDNIYKLDILYMTRVQKERFDDLETYEKLKNTYILDNEKLKTAKENLCIMHPLPRVDEISEEVDLDPRAIYFKQVECGMYARMALFLYVNNQMNNERELQISNNSCNNTKCITQIERNLAKIGENSCGYCEKPFKK